MPILTCILVNTENRRYVYSSGTAAWNESVDCSLFTVCLFNRNVFAHRTKIFTNKFCFNFFHMTFFSALISDNKLTKYFSLVFVMSCLGLWETDSICTSNEYLDVGTSNHRNTSQNIDNMEVRNDCTNFQETGVWRYRYSGISIKRTWWKADNFCSQENVF